MQPVQDSQTYPLGSLKARQKRIRDIHFALNDAVIPAPTLEELNDEQLAALQLALEGNGLYITGAAGMWHLPPSKPPTHPSTRSQEPERPTFSPRFVMPSFSSMGIVLPWRSRLVLEWLLQASTVSACAVSVALHHHLVRANPTLMGWVQQPVHHRR